MDVRTVIEEVADALGLVGREIVDEDVNLAPSGLAGDDVPQKRAGLLGRVASGGLAEHLSALGVESRIERQRAVAEVLEPVALGAAWRERKNGIEPIEGLDRCLLVHAEYRGMLRRIDVEPDHVGGLGLEVGIVRSHVALKAVGLESGSRPDAGNHDVTRAEMIGELAAAPVGGTIRRRPASPIQNLCFQFGRTLFHPPASMSREEACTPL